MTWPRLRPFIGALLLLYAPVAAGQVHEGQTIVKARLVADTVRVQPGKPFTAGVHLTVAPGWHVYWENPGDTALPIQVEWDLPPGTHASALRWPRPEKYQEGGGVTVFGYERETLLLTTISPAAALPDGSLTIQARADWLVCETLCIPGDAALELTLSVGEPAPSEDASLIRRFAATVPSAGARSGVRITAATVRKTPALWSFTLAFETGNRRLLAFFPRTLEGIVIDHGRIAVKDGVVRFTAQPDDATVTVQRISGVATTNRGSFNVSAVVSDEPAATTTVAPAAIEPPVSTADPVQPVADPAPPLTKPPLGGDWLERDFAATGPSARLPLATLLLFSMLGGLLLNVMPCVLPVLSLKILGFVHQAGEDPRRTRMLGLMFGGGVLVSFWILVAAVAGIRATAAQIGWGFQFQSPAFVVVMSIVVLVFAMNLFGVFEINAPVLSGAAVSGQGPGGAFVHGMLATVLATPCTAPFLGTAIGFAFTQSLPILFLAFTAAAIGLALPYVLLSWHPSWLRWLPRPGNWMIRFKQAMGFVLLATVVWLLSILGSQLGPEGVTWALVFLTIVAFAVWVVGQVPYTASRVSRAMWRVAAVVVIAGAYFWTFEHELRWREPVDVADASTAPRGGRSGGMEWEAFSLASLQERVERGETVFVNFTADWCWSCKVNERTVLASSSVQERMRELNVTTVKADWTRRNPEITRLLARFGRAGVPFYVVFPAGRLSSPIALSEVITPGSVIDAIDRAGPSRKEPNI